MRNHSKRSCSESFYILFTISLEKVSEWNQKSNQVDEHHSFFSEVLKRTRSSSGSLSWQLVQLGGCICFYARGIACVICSACTCRGNSSCSSSCSNSIITRNSTSCCGFSWRSCFNCNWRRLLHYPKYTLALNNSCPNFKL